MVFARWIILTEEVTTRCMLRALAVWRVACGVWRTEASGRPLLRGSYHGIKNGLKSPRVEMLEQLELEQQVN
ncbi:unnamed protein product, partial [Iphiclides podalirius]